MLFHNMKCTSCLPAKWPKSPKIPDGHGQQITVLIIEQIPEKNLICRAEIQKPLRHIAGEPEPQISLTIPNQLIHELSFLK